MTRARDVSNLLGTGTTTVKVSNIQNPSSSVANLSLASDGTVSGGIPSPNRNILYNGAMQVAQRGTSTASITTAGYYTADRWPVNVVNQGTWTQTVENDAPTGSGLRKSLKMLCTTADSSPASADEVSFDYKAEGQDLQRIAKGTASAQQLTLSFWVKSNVTGTYIAMLYDLDNARFVSQSYTISASATWEKKTITFPADTTGAFDNDNAASLLVRFFLGAGSSWTSGTLQTSWGSDTNANRAVGQTNLAAATNNYWQVTGVQLEVGSVASAFEFKPFGQELRECQRYYYQHISGNGVFSVVCSASIYASTESRGVISFPVTMRIAPSLSASTGTDHFRISSNNNSTSFNTLTINGATQTNAIIISSAHSALTAGNAGQIITGNTTASSLAFTAEL